MQKKLSWQIFSQEERTEVIDRVKHIISGSDGYILNFNMYSDLALTLSVEIEEKNIANLHQQLSDWLVITPLDSSDINSTSTKDRLIFMNISFGSGTGDLKQEIPQVPG